jgi:16S rRNA (cytosine967-C5)-methyltransferase
MERGEAADHALHRGLRAHSELHSTERRQIGEILYAMIRLKRRLDHVLSAGLAAAEMQPLSSYATPDVDRLRYATVLVTDFEQTPSFAAQYAGMDGRIVPALQAIARGVVTWPQDPVQRLAIQASLPDWAAHRMLAEYGEEAEALGKALNVRAPLTLRVNTLKATRDVLAQRLLEEELESTPGSLSPWALSLKGRHNVFGLESYKSGLFEVQDEGSQLIALATGAKPGDKVIDACCGAGGKALALAAMMENKGVVLTCDVSLARMDEVRPRARLAGAFNFQPLAVPTGPEGEKPLRAWKARADVVLVDAPCSGTGAWRRHADARWRLTPPETDAFPAMQAAILDRYAETVKPGGRLVYATCSLWRPENEGVADQFLATHPNFVADPLTHLPAEVLDSAGRMKTLPHKHGTDGFFAAAFRRT